jgi:hypothetical protein
MYEHHINTETLVELGQTTMKQAMMTAGVLRVTGKEFQI